MFLCCKFLAMALPENENRRCYLCAYQSMSVKVTLHGTHQKGKRRVVGFRPSHAWVFSEPCAHVFVLQSGALFFSRTKSGPGLRFSVVKPSCYFLSATSLPVKSCIGRGTFNRGACYTLLPHVLHTSRTARARALCLSL